METDLPGLVVAHPATSRVVPTTTAILLTLCLFTLTLTVAFFDRLDTTKARVLPVGASQERSGRIRAFW
jgi:hypothetical protein